MTNDIANPVSQLCTQNQFEDSVYKGWCDIMHQPVQYHRKQWEFVYICQALWQYGVLERGRLGMGFGVGREPLPAMFSTLDVITLATDMPNGQDTAWARTAQHSASIEQLYHPEICPAEDMRVEFAAVDMNNIRPLYQQGLYDFVWSACSLDHLGTLQKGLDFMSNAMKCVHPGGIGVFTTEFNLSDPINTVEAGPTVLYRESDLRTFADRMAEEGCEVAPFDLDIRVTGPYDSYVDKPPFRQDMHLRLLYDKFVITSVGLIIIRQ